MSDTGTFVKALQSRKDFTERKSLVASEARTNMLIGGFTILISLWFLVKDRLKPPVSELKEVHLRVWEVRKKQLMSDLFTGGVTLFLAYRVYRSYVPTNSEVSNAILIKYLRLKQVIDEDLYSVLKDLKPYRIEALNL